MQTSLTSNSRVANGILAIQTLDVERIKSRLQQPAPGGKSWTPQQAEEAETWYRRFLILSMKHPETTLVPTSAVDEFWHLHVLDMQAYQKDTRRIFGRMLFHTPLFKGEDMSREFAETQALFLKEFGEVPASEDDYRAASCNSGSCKNNVRKRGTLAASCKRGQVRRAGSRL